MKKISLLFLMLLTGIIVAEAQPKGYKNLKDTSSFIKKFDDKARTITTNEADFVQEKYVSVMTDKAISKGKFYYKKSNQMRWETTEPQSHIIVLNNGKMIMKEKGKVKTYDASSNKMFKGLNDMMLTTASGNMLNSKEYKHSLFENEKYFLIQLTPVAAATRKFVKVIEVTVEKGDYTVSQIKMIEPSEDYTRIEFSNKKINQPIGDDLFILK
jgi:outer membrane lipoprotein-sorting protein